jgi:pimeloyl-ACP methyl ester carboxylesterase
MASTEVEEEPVWFGPDGRLAGVLTRAPGNTRPRLAVLFPTVGANHRIGSNRLHVELGRELAAQGYLCLRMDIDGAGDSGQVCERERFWEYKINTYRDIVEGARWLRQVQGVEGCVLWGICSGAYMAYHAALAEDAVRGAVLLNLQLFRWRESEAGEAIARNQAKSFGFYLRAARNPETWSRLVAGGVSVRLIVLGLAARISMRLKARWALWRSKWSEQADTPARQVQRLSQRGCRISFVCTPEDTGLHEINSHLGRGAVQVAHLPGVAYIEVGHETSADHTFTSRPSQDWIKDWTHRHLQDHFPV